MKNDDLSLARSVLKGHVRLAVCKDGEIVTSDERGIKPILMLLEENPDALRGASVADKIIGKASAMLMIYAGVKECFGEVVSLRGLDVLKSAGIKCDYLNTTTAISNRRGDGICPMEKTVSRINDCEEAYKALRAKVFENNI